MTKKNIEAIRMVEFQKAYKDYVKVQTRKFKGILNDLKELKDSEQFERIVKSKNSTLHIHLLFQPKGFMNATILKCQNCDLTFNWDIMKQRYIQRRRSG